MGDVGSFLMGDTEDAKQTGGAGTLTAGQGELLDQITALLNEQLGSGVQAYGGQTVAPTTSTQNNIFSQASDMSGSVQPNQTALDAINKIMQGSGTVDALQYSGVDLGEFDPSTVNSWFQSSVYDPAMKNWESTIAPSIQEKFIGQNAGSSGAANRAIAGAGSDLASSLSSQYGNTLLSEKQKFDQNQLQTMLDQAQTQFGADTTAQGLNFTAGQNDLSNLLNVPGLATGVDQSQINQLQQLLGIGSAEQATDQTGLTSDYEQWLNTQAYNNPWLNLINSALNTTAFEPIVQGPTTSGGLISMIMPAISSYLGNS